MATPREAPSTPPPIIGKASRYTAFITPPKAQERTPQSRAAGVAATVAVREAWLESLPGSAFGFFWNAVVKVQMVHSAVDEYLAEWFVLNKSKYQWALNECNG